MTSPARKISQLRAEIMSKYRRWIEADELMKRWEIGPLDLTDYVLESRLIAYYRNKIPHDIKYDLMSGEELSEEYMEINGKWENALKKYVFIGDRITEFIFKYKDILNFEKEYQDDCPDIVNIREKPLCHNGRHRERCRALAAFLWEKYPDTTIEDMIKNYALIKYGCENKIPLYHGKTLRKWIHDLCPNNKPGRRPIE
jgi:hypothetical protein